VLLGIRPEDLEDAALEGAKRGAEWAGSTLTMDCTLREALGSEVLLHFAVPGGSAAFIARVDPETTAREGDRVRLAVNLARLHFFDPESGLAVYGEPARMARSLEAARTSL
jgi:multiple sugar transport system ATP-binding protein